MTDETPLSFSARLKRIAKDAADLLRDFVAHQIRRFFNLETLIAVYRIPLYWYAISKLNLELVDGNLIFEFGKFAWVILAFALDRAGMPLLDFFVDPVKRQAKRDLAVAMVRTELAEKAYQKKRHASASR